MADQNFDLSKLPPEVVQAIFGIGSAAQDEDQTQAALARSMALQEAALQGPRHTTALGAALGGAADMVTAFRGRRDEQAARSQLEQDKYKRDLAETRAMYRMYPPAPAPAPGDPNDPVLGNQPPGYVKGPFGF